MSFGLRIDAGFVAPIALILLFQAILLSQLPRPTDLWWDECTYLLLSQNALHSPLTFRIGIVGWHIGSLAPHLLPWMIAILGGEAAKGLLFVSFCSLLFSILYFYFVEKNFGATTAFLSCLLMLSSFQFLFLSTRLFTEIPSLVLSIGLLLALMKRKYALSGVIFGLSIITRYPNFVLLVPVVWAIFSEKEKYAAARRFAVPAILISSIQFILSDILEYGIPFSSLAGSLSVFSTAPPASHLFYLGALLGFNWILFIFFPIGAYIAYKRKEGLLLLWFASYLVFQSLMPHKEIRYSIGLLPAFVALGSLGFFEAASWASGKRKAPIAIALMLLVAYSFMDLDKKTLELRNLAGRTPLLHETTDIVGNSSVATNYFIPIFCHLQTRVYMIPHTLEEFRDIEGDVDYLAIFRDSSLGNLDRDFPYLNMTNFTKVVDLSSSGPYMPTAVYIYKKGG